MMFESLVGWSVLATILVTASACLVLPPLHLLDRRLSPGRRRRIFRGLAVLVGAIGLWYAIPFVVQHAYRYL